MSEPKIIFIKPDSIPPEDIAKLEALGITVIRCAEPVTVHVGLPFSPLNACEIVLRETLDQLATAQPADISKARVRDNIGWTVIKAARAAMCK